MTLSGFTPNRIMPSAAMFGSLPTGVVRERPWETLLFRPAKQTPGTLHPGASNPPDHLVLDLFQMPIVEPWVISEPFSTAGKVNLNFQIAPFSYIKRSTAFQAVLDSVRVTALPDTNPYWKQLGPNAEATNYRYRIDGERTAGLVENERFAKNQPFITASEICEVLMVPEAENTTNSINPAPTNFSAAASIDATEVETWWQTHGLGTADNLRERPYAFLYPRLTTKSDTFSVHLRVQKHRNSPNSDPETFDSTLGDAIQGAYRGSFII